MATRSTRYRSPYTQNSEHSAMNSFRYVRKGNERFEECRNPSFIESEDDEDIYVRGSQFARKYGAGFRDNKIGTPVSSSPRSPLLISEIYSPKSKAEKNSGNTASPAFSVIKSLKSCRADEDYIPMKCSMRNVSSEPSISTIRVRIHSIPLDEKSGKKGSKNGMATSSSRGNSTSPKLSHHALRPIDAFLDEDLLIMDGIPIIRLLQKSKGSPKSKSDSESSGSTQAATLYKTELCRSWEESGHCRYGTKCQFAHGKEDLRAIARHPKYKTEICRTFTNEGTCPYGRRCRFVHAGVDGETNKSNISSIPSTPAIKKPTSLNSARRLPVFQRICP